MSKKYYVTFSNYGTVTVSKNEFYDNLRKEIKKEVELNLDLIINKKFNSFIIKYNFDETAFICNEIQNEEIAKGFEKCKERIENYEKIKVNDFVFYIENTEVFKINECSCDEENFFNMLNINILKEGLTNREGSPLLLLWKEKKQ